MLIDFINPIYSVDDNSGRAFVELLNIILLSEHILDLNKSLIQRNYNSRFGCLSGYFKWIFSSDSFTLRQRLHYGSELCFDKMILDLKFISLVSPDRVMAINIAN